MKSTVVEHDEQHLSYSRYAVGFVTSVVLTVAAYLFATHAGGDNRNLVAVGLAVLAVMQFVVQMVLFLHVGEERGPRWKLAMMFMMLTVVLILVGASIWIMNNLNYRMTPQQMQQYLRSQDNL